MYPNISFCIVILGRICVFLLLALADFDALYSMYVCLFCKLLIVRCTCRTVKMQVCFTNFVSTF